jgi:O-antigen/teichoic acid export membrane protein
LATIPVIAIIAASAHFLINLISSVPVDNALFMLYLLPVPYLYDNFSLAGNIVVMSGKSFLVLVNSSVVALLNFVLNLALIPEYGLIGAATASSIAVGIVTFLEVVEARRFVGAKLQFRKIFWLHVLGILLISTLVAIELNL